jgi:putative transposase
LKQRDPRREPEQVREFKQLQDGNTKLKRLEADLSLDKVMPQDALGKILRPSRKRNVLAYLCTEYAVNERRAR